MTEEKEVTAVAEESPVSPDPKVAAVVVKERGLGEFMLKALMFWVVISAIGLYLYTVYSPQSSPTVVEQPDTSANETVATVAPVEEIRPRFVPITTQVASTPAGNFRPLPADQVQLIISTFAPEQLAAEGQR